MIVLRSENELQKMLVAGKISKEALLLAGSMVSPGVSTGEIDEAVRRFIIKSGARPNFLGYGGYPKSCCISINNEVIHGIPSFDRIISEGDIVSIDVGAEKDGYNGDNAATFPAGKISPEAEKLLRVTSECLERGVAAAQAGNRIGDIGFAVQSHAEANGFSVVRKYVGHGIGEDMHESPDVPNYGTRGKGIRLVPGMMLAIEPMINAGSFEVNDNSKDGWLVVTKDGSLSAHFENSVAITKSGNIILTKI
jgi:methionyl aminopeptidase